MTSRRLLSVFEAVLEALREPPKEPRACCYTCRNQIPGGQLLFYAPPPHKTLWCQLCGTKVRVNNGVQQCVFFLGLKPGEID